MPFAWVAADEVYGQNPGLRDWLEDRQIGYVMAVPCSELITVPAGRKRADALAALVPRPGVAAPVVRGRVEGAAAV